MQRQIKTNDNTAILTFLCLHNAMVKLKVIKIQ